MELIKITNPTIATLVIRLLNNKGVSILNPQAKVKQPCILVNDKVAVLIPFSSFSLPLEETTDVAVIEKELFLTATKKPVEVKQRAVRGSKPNVSGELGAGRKHLTEQIEKAQYQGYTIQGIANLIGLKENYLRILASGKSKVKQDRLMLYGNEIKKLCR